MTFSSKQAFNVLVGAIPVFGGKVLLLKRSYRESFLPGVWGLPAGKVSFGEALEEAVMRELKEESGLTGSLRTITGYSSFLSTRGDTQLHNVQVNYVVDCDSCDVQLGPASDSYRWVTISDIGPDVVDDFTLRTIRQAQL